MSGDGGDVETSAVVMVQGQELLVMIGRLQCLEVGSIELARCNPVVGKANNRLTVGSLHHSRHSSRPAPAEDSHHAQAPFALASQIQALRSSVVGPPKYAHIHRSIVHRRKTSLARAVSLPCLQADRVVSCADEGRQGGLQSEGQIRTRSPGPSSRPGGLGVRVAVLPGFGQGESRRNHTDEGAQEAWPLARLRSGCTIGSRYESMGM